MEAVPDSPDFPIQKSSRRQKLLLGLNFLVRMVATGVLILAIYFFIPVEGAAGLATTGALALAAMVIYTFAVVRMIGRISRAPNPMLVVGEAVVVAVLLFVALFALLYMVMTTSNPDAFSVVLDKSAALYFAMTITSTVGFGDIVPVSSLARNVVTFQMLLNLIVLGAAVRGVVYAGQLGWRDYREKKVTQEENQESAASARPGEANPDTSAGEGATGTPS
jgi:multisubunit Na+/H+ antiporter MnhB subunit